MKFDISIFYEKYGEDSIEFLKIFIEENNESIELLTNAIQQNDPNGIKFYAHKIKGTALILGDEEFAQHAFNLETKNTDTEVVSNHYKSLALHYGELISYLDSVIQSGNH